MQLTRDGGKSWRDVTANIASAGGPADLWVSRVFASNFDRGTAYVSKTGFRADDFRPFLFKTTDFGRTWTRIVNGLPNKSINVVIEDPRNGRLLFIGNDRGVYVSVDGGVQWVALKGNMPTVPVHDLVIHPRDNDLVAGTYGRGLWFTDIGPLREMDTAVLESDLTLFSIEPRTPRGESAWGNYQLYGDRYARTPNEPDALAIVYYLREAGTSATITAADKTGKAVRTLAGPAKSGINRVYINVMGERGQAPLVPGDYLVTVKTGSLSESKTATVRGKP